MPPECLDGVATTKSDVWSFGVFLWELFSMGQLPYQDLLDNRQVIEFIRSRRHATRPRRCSSSAASGGGGAQLAPEQPLNNGAAAAANLDESAASDAADLPPLPMPHENTPKSVYAIMCACWASCPENRPQFEEIANRLYWCLQMDDVLATSLPCFYEQQTPQDGAAAATNGLCAPQPQHKSLAAAGTAQEQVEEAKGYQNQKIWLLANNSK